jgi:hypothetical protein
LKAVTENRQAMDVERMKQGEREGWQHASADWLDCSISVKKTRSDSREFCVTIEKMNHIQQRLIRDKRIGVQEEDVTACRVAEGDVVRARKPNVRTAVDRMDVRKLDSNHLNAAVDGSVVDNDEFDRKVAMA